MPPHRHCRRRPCAAALTLGLGAPPALAGAHQLPGTSCFAWLANMSPSRKLHPDFGPSYGAQPVPYGIPVTYVASSHAMVSVSDTCRLYEPWNLHRTSSGRWTAGSGSTSSTSCPPMGPGSGSRRTPHLPRAAQTASDRRWPSGLLDQSSLKVSSSSARTR